MATKTMVSATKAPMTSDSTARVPSSLVRTGTTLVQGVAAVKHRVPGRSLFVALLALVTGLGGTTLTLRALGARRAAPTASLAPSTSVDPSSTRRDFNGTEPLRSVADVPAGKTADLPEKRDPGVASLSVAHELADDSPLAVPDFPPPSAITAALAVGAFSTLPSRSMPPHMIARASASKAAPARIAHAAEGHPGAGHAAKAAPAKKAKAAPAKAPAPKVAPRAPAPKASAHRSGPVARVSTPHRPAKASPKR